MSTSYKAIIIGSGQGGTPLATTFAKEGKTALIESAFVGGTCINYGCTPTKTMVASGRVAHVVSQAKKYGVELSGAPKTNMQTVRKRKRDIVDSFRGGSERRVKTAENLEFYHGKARFVGQKELEIEMEDGSGTKRVTGELIFINVGCRPSKLNIPGADTVPLLDSTSVMELAEVPEHLLVIGGGYIGVEFSQLFRRLGSTVTIVQRGGQLLGREDKDVADAVKDILTEDGLKIMLNTTPKSISKSSKGVDLEVSNAGGGSVSISASHVLVALGRVPNTDYLNPAAGGVDLDARGFVRSNGLLETSVAGVYAMGDVRGGPAFTHISYDDSRVIKHNVLNRSMTHTPMNVDERLVPYTVFMDPQLGSVGLTESQALKLVQKEGRKLQVAKMPMAYVARALEMDETRGFMKAIVDAETRQILGATVLGIEGGEITSMLQIAMMGKVTYTALQDAIFTHPLLAEALNNLWGFLEDVK